MRADNRWNGRYSVTRYGTWNDPSSAQPRNCSAHTDPASRCTAHGHHSNSRAGGELATNSSACSARVARPHRLRCAAA